MRRTAPGRRAVTTVLAALSLAACALRTAPPAKESPPASQASVASPHPAKTGRAGPSATREGRPALAIVTGPAHETDQQVGLDLSRLVAAPLGIDLDVRSSKGAIDNMHRLHDDASVDLAIVQYDVLKAFDDQVRKGDRAAQPFIEPVRIVAALYTQEIYFIVRRDSSLRSIDQLRDRKINVGVVGSGGALTAAAVYRQLFGVPIASSRTTYLDARAALAALTIDRSIDTMVVVAGQPAGLLADLKPEAREFIRLLPLDARLPSSKAALRSYFPATIRAANYAQWLATDVPTLAVMSVLVTAADHGRGAALATLAHGLCAQLDTLRRQGHPKWREVDPTLTLGTAFSYLPAGAVGLDHCPDARRAAAAAPT